MSAAPSLRLHLRPSPFLAALIVAAHALAGAAAALALPGPAGAVLGAALLALGLAAAWSRALLRSGGSVRAMAISPPGGVELELADGRRVAAEAKGRRYVTRWAVTLGLRTPGRLTILVTPGMLSPEDLRRLRLWALWDRVPPVAGVQLPA